MPQLTIPDLEDALLERLRRQAADHGHTVEAEVGEILTSALQSSQSDVWAGIDAIRNRLATTGRSFTDSTELVRTDRDR